ncbi:hypothetical protein [Natrialba aegyptia]|uniref:hypothetical protein n=1 Tax=Natrialba aegyptia TaxID=129789 RepID=UPI000AAA63C8|nr:hypothetical protein [Natrialba aegyptia]
MSDPDRVPRTVASDHVTRSMSSPLVLDRLDGPARMARAARLDEEDEVGLANQQ